MTRNVLKLTLALLVAVALVGDARAQAPAADPGRAAAFTAVLRVSREGRIRFSPGGGWRQSDLSQIMASVAAGAWKSDAGKKAMPALGLTEATAPDALSWSASADPMFVFLILDAPRDTPEAREAATRLLDELATKAVPAAFDQWAAEYNQLPVLRAKEGVQAARKEVEVASDRASAARQRVRELSGILDPSPESVRSAVARLDQDKQRITLELAGQAARQRALEERVAKLSEVAAKRVGEDAIAAELEKIVKLREEEAASVADLNKRRTVSESEVRTAQTQVAEAKARLLERREAVAKAAGAELLGDLNKELVTLTITFAENEARLRHIEERLGKLARALDGVDELELVLAQAARARRQLDQAETRLQDATQRAAAATPTVVPVQWNAPVFRAPGAGEPGGEH